MKGLVVCHKGTEDICSNEIKELINADTKTYESCVEFSAKDLKDFCRLCYLSQSARRVVLLLCDFPLKKNSDILPQIAAVKVEEWLTEKNSFAARCLKEENDDFSTNEIEEEIGAGVIDRIQKEKGYQQKVNLSKPDVTFFSYVIGEHCFFGIDLGDDLSKRDYNIFTNAHSLKGTLGYCLIREAGYNGKGKLVDPFSRTGTVPIEAALYASRFAVRHFSKDKFLFLKLKGFSGIDFDKYMEEIDGERQDTTSEIVCADSTFHFISNAKKNAKIASIEKQIQFSRIETEWLDTKLQEGKVDFIISYPPVPSKATGQKDIEKLYNELFYQAEFVIAKEGTVCLITTKKDLLVQYAHKFKFKLVREKDVKQGMQEMKILIFKKE